MPTKPWKNAASLIVVARNLLAGKTPMNVTKNYQVLTMKRSSNASFMPNSYVFPGGTSENSDSSRDWLKLYNTFGVTNEKLGILDNGKCLPPIFEQGQDDISRSISLRITAIRETFEESGILICRKANENNDDKWANCIENSEIVEWQQKIHNDSNKFLQMCYKFEMFPDIFVLKEWSNWLTPSILPKRFDTIFFITMFPNTPNIHGDCSEVQLLEWNLPESYLQLYRDKNIMLPPPQFYEFSRLCNFKSIEDLSQFSEQRSRYGCELFLPHTIIMESEILQILPGDDIYPGEQEAEKSKGHKLENLPECKTLHRMVQKGKFISTVLTSNYVPKYNHIVPVNAPDYLNKCKH